MAAVAELPERRRWKGYAVLERDERLYRIGIGDPEHEESLKPLLELGWHVVPVEIIESNS